MAFLEVPFKLDYVNADGNISNYYPDFIVKKSDAEVFIVETKGLEDLDVAPKWERLKQWCTDLNATQSVTTYSHLFVSEATWEKYPPHSFAEAVNLFVEEPAPLILDTPSPIPEHSLVKVSRQLSSNGYVVPAGSIGVIVDIYHDGEAYEVEFDIAPALTLTVLPKDLDVVDA